MNLIKESVKDDAERMKARCVVEYYHKDGHLVAATFSDIGGEDQLTVTDYGLIPEKEWHGQARAMRREKLKAAGAKKYFVFRKGITGQWYFADKGMGL